MLNIKYEVYQNDYCRHDESKTFQNLEEFANWMYENARICNGKSDVYFTDPEDRKADGSDLNYSCLYFKTADYRTYWSFCIEDTSRGIIYTTGKFTCGKKHWSHDMKEWFKKGCNGELEPKFTFAD